MHEVDPVTRAQHIRRIAEEASDPTPIPIMLIDGSIRGGTIRIKRFVKGEMVASNINVGKIEGDFVYSTIPGALPIGLYKETDTQPVDDGRVITRAVVHAIDPNIYQSMIDSKDNVSLRQMDDK